MREGREKLLLEDSQGVGLLVAAAHELKTPLAIIAQLASALEDVETLGSAEERYLALRRIRLSAERGIQLAQGLTVGYRLKTDQLRLFELEPLDAHRICQEVAHELTPLATAYDHTIHLSASAHHQLVVGNTLLLKCVFTNLLDNAIRHTEGKTPVKIQLMRHKELVRMSTFSEGVPDVSRREFSQLGQRLGKELQPFSLHAGGSGLGLYIAQQMAVAMGGSVGVGGSVGHKNAYVDLLRSTQMSLL